MLFSSDLNDWEPVVFWRHIVLDPLDLSPDEHGEENPQLNGLSLEINLSFKLRLSLLTFSSATFTLH